MDRHYTYEEILSLVHGGSALPEEFLTHIALCDRCAEMFFEASQEIPLSPVRSVRVNTMERIALKRQQMRSMFYNLKVAFGVSLALLMLFTVPLRDEPRDIIRTNSENMSSITEKADKFKESFDEFVDNFMKGTIKNDKTEK